MAMPAFVIVIGMEYNRVNIKVLCLVDHKINIQVNPERYTSNLICLSKWSWYVGYFYSWKVIIGEF